MYKTQYGYRHRQFRIERDPDCSLTPSRDYNGWFVLPTDDYMGVMIPDSTEPFRTLRGAVDSIDRAIAADLRCPFCDLYIGDPDDPRMPSVAHDLSACSEHQWNHGEL